MVTLVIQCTNRYQQDTYAKLALIDWCERAGIVMYEVSAADNYGKNKFTFEADDDNIDFMVLKTYLLNHQKGNVEFTL